ncbi:hypothetical protein Ae201684P_003859 [Aphanomyces euteiches]|uniref:Uncharacterized protein n=1 Tax=Aphanomyces euteiches TaxID=100861 RepID=A0A6G0XT78_9STRA|nr:hypothetical protein Ae201684_001483 [Aphanomyces euteiches]KAH9075175.1 hypothetical protein Ae201684P_003859 [Aphanomyces euteiches]KAH9141352.1 hypothetical protein AeRB84_014553 [Aphanomyces euteiches]
MSTSYQVRSPSRASLQDDHQERAVSQPAVEIEHQDESYMCANSYGARHISTEKKARPQKRPRTEKTVGDEVKSVVWCDESVALLFNNTMYAMPRCESSFHSVPF